MAGTVITLLLLVLFHQVLKRPLLALLPESAAGRLSEVADDFRWSPAAQTAWVVVSAVIGVLTHLLWDALVHENGSVTWSPLPDSPAVTEALWWGSTLAGALVIAAWLGNWLRRTPRRPVPSRTTLGTAGRLWASTLVVLAGLAGVALKMVWRDIGISEAVHSAAAMRQVVTGGMSGVAVGLLIYAVLWNLSGRARDSGRE